MRQITLEADKERTNFRCSYKAMHALITSLYVATSSIHDVRLHLQRATPSHSGMSEARFHWADVGVQ